MCRFDLEFSSCLGMGFWRRMMGRIDVSRIGARRRPRSGEISTHYLTGARSLQRRGDRQMIQARVPLQ